eukprot:592513-Pyramimonas_sp.AAC.1
MDRPNGTGVGRVLTGSWGLLGSAVGLLVSLVSNRRVLPCNPFQSTKVGFGPTRKTFLNHGQWRPCPPCARFGGASSSADEVNKQPP